MRRLSIILILFIFSFCTKRKSDLPQLISHEKDSVLILDSKIMLRSQAPLLAVNFLNDTIVPNFKDMAYFYNMRNVKVDDSLKFNSENIKIFIDTTYSFSNQGFLYREIAPLTEEERQQPAPKFKNNIDEEKYIYRRYFKQSDSLKSKYLKSYPVLIYNKSNSDLYFGTSPILIIQEALDIDNQWKPIEFSFQMPGCGVAASIVSYRVQPKHYLATAIIKYKGNFKTKIRVNYLRGRDVIYSNEIVGYINRSQFKTENAEKFRFDVYGKSNAEWRKKDLSWMLHKPIED